MKKDTDLKLVRSNEPEDIHALMAALGRSARQSARMLALAPTDTKNKALSVAAKKIREKAGEILTANAKDMAEARASGTSAAYLGRLELDPQHVENIARGIEEIAALPDPVGRILARFSRPNGLVIDRVATPLGVIGVIFESRPSVAADAGALCLKSGNAVILRGGSESFHSVSLIHEF